MVRNCRRLERPGTYVFDEAGAAMATLPYAARVFVRSGILPWTAATKTGQLKIEMARRRVRSSVDAVAKIQY